MMLSKQFSLEYHLRLRTLDYNRESGTRVASGNGMMQAMIKLVALRRWKYEGARKVYLHTLSRLDLATSIPSTIYVIRKLLAVNSLSRKVYLNQAFKACSIVIYSICCDLAYILYPLCNFARFSKRVKINYFREWIYFTPKCVCKIE